MFKESRLLFKVLSDLYLNEASNKSFSLRSRKPKTSTQKLASVFAKRALMLGEIFQNRLDHFAFI